MSDLVQKKCMPCVKGSSPLKGAALSVYREQLPEGWQIVQEMRLEKEYQFKNFKEALYFANRIGAIAEEEGHHPDLFISWGKVKIVYFTHAIQGLSESDFIMAAKSEACYV